MASFDKILAHYEEGRDAREQQEEWWAAKALCLKAAIRRACLSLIECPLQGNFYLHPHQWRLNKDVFKTVAKALAYNSNCFSSLITFDEIHKLVKSKIMTTTGAGPLYAYDVAHRIGLHLGIRPDRVYLHRGGLRWALEPWISSDQKDSGGWN